MIHDNGKDIKKNTGSTTSLGPIDSGKKNKVGAVRGTKRTTENRQSCIHDKQTQVNQHVFVFFEDA